MTSMAISNGNSNNNKNGKDDSDNCKDDDNGKDDNDGKDDDGGGGVPVQKTTINQMQHQKKWQR